MATPSCGCPRHKEYAAGTNFTLLDVRHKKIKNSTIFGLLGSSRASYICTSCVSHYENLNAPVAKKSKSSVDHIISSIEKNEFSKSDLEQLAKCIGKHVSNDVYNDCENIKKDYTSEEGLLAFNPIKWLTDRNPVVIAFFTGVVGNDAFECKKKNACLVSAVDCLYKARCLTLVTPLAFANNLLSYHISGSKLVCDLASNISPAGSYSTILKWLENHSCAALPSPPAQDCVTFLDNNQVLARNWRVRYDSKLMVSVITTLIHILPAKGTFLQFDITLSPSSWLYNNTLSFSQVTEKISLLISNFQGKFNILRNEFLSKRVRQVHAEQTCTNGLCTDSVDQMDMHSNTDKNDLLSVYKSFPHSHPEQHPDVLMGEPCMVNPCSYENVKMVLQHINKKCNIGNGRKWTIVGSDGLPYLLGSRLMEKNTSLQNIVMVPGLGHFEINMVRCLFKLLWDVVLIDLAKMLNYKSANALAACKSACNHHKSWQIIVTFFFATCDELILPFARDCHKRKVSPTLNDFYSFLSSAKDPNYIFLKDVIFSYLFALMLFRTGVRRNNSELILAGRLKFATLFFGFNMPNYQEIELRDLRTRVLLPEQLEPFWKDNESFSVSGDACKGEGGDFVLEARNRKTKQWMPPGVPDQKRWLRSVRNVDRLDQIRQTFLPEKDVLENTYQVDLRKEIVHWRGLLRRKQYLSSLSVTKKHISLSGEELDESLVNFSGHCKGNRDLYLERAASILGTGKTEKLTPVFITKQDRQKHGDIKYKTKLQIQKMTKDVISELSKKGSAMADILQDTWERENYNAAKKEALICFYRQALSALEECSSTYSEGSDDEDNDMDT